MNKKAFLKNKITAKDERTLKAMQSLLRFDSCMEHEICFFNSTAWGKHQEGHEPIDPRRRKQEKRDFFPKGTKKRKDRETGRSTYMGSGGREVRRVAARRRRRKRRRPLPDQRCSERTGAMREKGGDLGLSGRVGEERETMGQGKKTSINLALFSSFGPRNPSRYQFKNKT